MINPIRLAPIPGRRRSLILAGVACVVLIMISCSFPSPTVTPTSHGGTTNTPVGPTETRAPTRDTATAAIPTSATPSKSVVTETPSGAFTPRLIAYYYGIDHSHTVADIPDGLSVVIYAFIKVNPDGECVSINPATDAANFPLLQALKQHAPGLKTVVSVGGYAESANFSDATASDSTRVHFAQTCAAFMAANGFDGIDIDWEFPVSGGLAGNGHRPEDKHNFTLLLADLRKSLDGQAKKDGRAYLLSIAAPAGPSEYAHLELSQIHPYLDWITVMAYSFYTAASPMTNFASPLFPSSTDPSTDPTRRLKYNGDAAIQAYLAAGVPPEKLSLGVPFYGHAWKGVPAVNHGLYQENSGPYIDSQAPKGVWDSLGEITYRDLAQYYLEKWPRYWQPEAMAAWLYEPAEQVMVTYEDAESLAAKAAYVRTKRLGGVSIWQISQDDARHTLVGALALNLAGH